MVIRPTALRLSFEPRAGRVAAEIRSTSFLGAVRRHVLAVGDLRLIVDQPLNEVEPTAASVWLDVDPRAGLHVLPGRIA